MREGSKSITGDHQGPCVREPSTSTSSTTQAHRKREASALRRATCLSAFEKKSTITLGALQSRGRFLWRLEL